MNICVVGVGYVGLVTGACFAEFGVDVTLVDKDPERIDCLNRGRLPFYEPGLEELVAKNLKEGRLTFTTDLAEGICRSLVVFIAVGTPMGDEGEADLSFVKEVARSIGRCMDGYKVVVTKSTVPVGANKMVEQIIRENLAEDHPFDVASNPEFLREGAAIEDFMRPDRVIIGTESEQAKAILKDLYRPLYLIETPFVITDVNTAEMIKYASNAFLATKISFINEMANLCDKVGSNVQVVAKAMGLDGRIGKKFLHAGPGYGGSCFPKDTRALGKLAQDAGYDFKIIKAVIEVNDRQRDLMVEKIDKAAQGLTGKKATVLGLTFKPNTDDIREAPAVYITQKLLERGAKVTAFDPAGMPNARKALNGANFAENLYDAARDADLLVLMTEWNQFRNIQWDRIKEVMKGRVVVDLKNIYEPDRMRELGFDYFSVGR